MKFNIMALLFLATSAGAAEPGIVTPDTAELIERCAPKVDVETLGAIVRTESSGHVFVLSDDGPARLPWQQRKHMIRSIYPGSAAEASEIARKLIDDGHLVGIGLTQINSQNLNGLGVTINQLLDPCMNLAVGARLLRSLYQKALRSGRYPTPDRAVGAALSAYNTGSFSDGFANGYVSRVLANMSAGVPRLRATSEPTRGMGPALADGGGKNRDVSKRDESALKARTASLDVVW